MRNGATDQPSTAQTAPSLSDFAEQGAVYAGLIKTLEEGTFVHAYLISGMKGVGKRALARQIAQYLLCTGEKKPCKRCPACMQAASGSHPDIVTVQPGVPINPHVERNLKSIPVDEIRMVNELVGQQTYTGGRRIIMIFEAERMTQQAQNALLKTLEEPQEGAVFLLTTSAPALLLPTILSRVRQLKLHPWPLDYIRQTLLAGGVEDTRAAEAAQFSGGSIGAAKEIAVDEAFWQRREEVMRDFMDLESRSDVLRISTAWKDRKDSADQLLNDLDDMIRQLMLVRFGQADPSLIASYPAWCLRLAREGDLNAFVALFDAVRDARKLRNNQVTWQAVIEKLLLRIMEEKNKWSM